MIERHDSPLPGIIPDMIQAIIGWRCWGLTPDGLLTSMNDRSIVWHPRQAGQATCEALDAVNASLPRNELWAIVQAHRWDKKQLVGYDFKSGESYFEPYPDLRLWVPRSMPVEGYVPGPGCQCGIYAVATPSAARHYLAASANTVLGSAYLWGRIVKHDQGWRAEFAYPAALQAPKELCERYGVPQIPKDDGDPFKPDALAKLSANPTFRAILSQEAAIAALPEPVLSAPHPLASGGSAAALALGSPAPGFRSRATVMRQAGIKDRDLLAAVTALAFIGLLIFAFTILAVQTAILVRGWLVH